MSSKNAKNMYPIEVSYDYEDKQETVNVKKKLSFTECISFVNAVADSVIDNEFGYQPMLYKFTLDKSILYFYTNYKLKKSLVKNYDLLSNSNIINNIKKVIDKSQLDEVKDSIEKTIEHKKRIVENQTEFDGLINDLRNILNKYDNKLAEFLKNINPKDLQNILKVFGSLDSNDENFQKTVIKTILENISNKDKENKENKVIPIEGKK